MSWREEDRHNSYIVYLSGRLDSFTASEFEKTALKIPNNEKNKLIIDISKLDYISSAGLRVILLLGKSMRSKGGDMILNGSYGIVKEILEVSGFLTIFRSTDTIAEAEELNTVE